MTKKINIKGSIMSDGSEWLANYGYSVTTPKQVIDILNDAKGEDIELYINSPGGSTMAASEIYSSIREYKGNVVAKIVGYAASAASWIALAANRVLISPTGLIMVHNSSSYTSGDYRDMNASKEMLQAVDTSIRNAFKAKTKLSDEELKDLMNKKTWLSAEEALKNNFADEIMFDDEIYNSNSFVDDMQIPNEKILNMIINTSIENKTEEGRKSMENVENKTEENVVTQGLLNVSENSINNDKKELVITTENLKENHRDIYDEIFNRGVIEERKRIENIEELEITGFEELVKNAKFKEAIKPEELAMNIVKKQKNLGASFIENIKSDKEEVILSPAKTKEESIEDVVSLIANAGNKNRK